jgi:putative DNA methylase
MDTFRREMKMSTEQPTAHRQPKQQSLFPAPTSVGPANRGRGIERQFDIPFVAGLALREKQIQQNYRPVIAVHKWFARRPGTLFRALLISEFVEGSLRENFFQPQDLSGLSIADPFMGGGTPLVEANRMGCNVIGSDINPMAYWIVRQEIEHLDLHAYRAAAEKLGKRLEREVGRFYRTRCLLCDRPDASVKYFLWVKTHRCSHCGKEFDLFPGFLLAENRRHPKNVVVCSICGTLNEAADSRQLGVCRQCKSALKLNGPARRNRCSCPHCGEPNGYPQPKNGAPNHRMFALEYHCPTCKAGHEGRFFKVPDSCDLEMYAQAVGARRKTRATYVPDDEIPPGDETSRLLRWGYKHYREMFNERQLLGLELICRAIAEERAQRIKSALATNLSDLLRYQNMLCRYDASALKSLDIFSVHGFPVGLIECESNLLGIEGEKNGANIGSGGWSNIVEKFVRARRYCEEPFEISYDGGRKCIVPVPGEWIGDDREGNQPRKVVLNCGSSSELSLARRSLDAVFTDPPYFANVQYAELMDFCYVWLRRLIGSEEKALSKPTTRREGELTGNETMERGLEHFTGGLSAVFRRMAEALKPGAPLAFTYHHNSVEAYYPIAVAILDAGLVCSASLPCPAEMSASIHINRTGSSIVDTIFVCRSTGRVAQRTIVSTPEELAGLVGEDLEHLRAGGVAPTRGDARCVAYGHMIRLAVWNLRKGWSKDTGVLDKIRVVSDAIHAFGGPSAVDKIVSDDLMGLAPIRRVGVGEPEVVYGTKGNEILF